MKKLLFFFLASLILVISIVAQQPLSKSASTADSGISVRCLMDTIVITTNSITGISKNTATSGGNIISDGGATIISRGVCWSTSPNPDTTNSITKDGSGVGNYTTEIAGLIPNTTYYVRAFAINSLGVGYGNELSFTTILHEIIYGSISDEGGTEYKTVKIGSQVWMAENLRSVGGSDGKSSPLIEDGVIWGFLPTPAYCWYNNDVSYKDTYGALFNYHIIESRNICPGGGWRVPSEIDWKILEDYLGGADIAGGKMKESGTVHWNSPNLEATDQFGFTALPAGQRSLQDGRFSGLGSSTSFWSVTAADPSKSWALYLHHDSTNVSHVPITDKTSGHSVRCLWYVPALLSPDDIHRGLIAYYPLNGNIKDESGNGHHGTANGGILTTDRFGNANSAYTFTGESNTLSFAGYQIAGSNFTIAGWVKITDENADTIFQNTSPSSFKILLRIVNHRYQIELVIGGNKFILYDEQGIYEIDPQHPRSDFLMLKYQHFNSAFSFHINNRYVAVLFAEGKIIHPVFPITMKNDIVYSFKGIVDDIRIYDRLLDNAEMEALNYEEDYPDQFWQLATLGLTSLTQTSACVEGLMYSGRSTSIEDKGFCWSTSANPDTTDNKISVGSVVGSFSSKLTGLTPNTTYYIRAYAFSNSSIAFGNELIFKTLSDSNNLKNGLIAYYPFNGNANDESGNGHHGVVDGATLTTDRFSSPDKAYYFNGQGNSVSIVDFNIPLDSVTITCWVKVMSPNVSQIFISKNHGPGDVELLIKSINNRYTIEWTIGGVYFSLADDHGYYPIDPYQPEFAFLALCYNGQKVDFYINNQLVASRNISGKIAKSTLPMVFGRFASGTNPENFNGTLDDIRIYDRVLNKDEIRALYYEFYNQAFLPQITTVSINNITTTKAWSGGDINRNGDYEILMRGVCWSTSTDPDTSDFRTDECKGVSYASLITDLLPNTYYFVKAYAINQTGIGYGNQLCFKTLEDSSVNIQNGLVAYYPFNGDARDESGNQFNGIVQRTTLSSDRFGRNNSSYEFETNKATIKLPNRVLNDFSYSSISLWVYWFGEKPSIILAKQNDYVDSYYIFGIGMYNAGGGLGFGDPGRVYFRAKNGSLSIQSNSLLESNKWNHLIITVGLDIKLYINGILDNKITGSDFILPNDVNAISTNLGVWLQNGKYDGFFNGKLDDIRIYNREINTAEINTLYRECGINLNSELVAFYPFNGNANDESGNSHNGVVDGATLTTDRFGNTDNAYYFNGQGNTISISDFNIPSDSITVSCWVKVLNPLGIQDFISKHHSSGDVELLIRSIDSKYAIEWTIGDTYFRLANDFGCFPIDPDYPRFDFLTLVYNGKKVDFYVNNQLVATKDVSGKIANNLLPMVFGKYAPGMQEYLNGTLDDVRIYNRALNTAEIQALYNEITKKGNISINSPSMNTFLNSIFELPIAVSISKPNYNALSYQFDFMFDPQKLQFQDYSIAGTIAENGIIQVNSQNDKLSIAWAGQTALADSGTLVKLRFKALESGTVTPVILNFLVNTDTVKNITNGSITISPDYGDVDGNGAIQSFDAALALQYSVGLDPLPDIDPLPWEDWRITLTNVDGENDISAYDASLILQYAVGIIHSFPVQGHLKSTSVSQADVYVKIENGNMVFRSSGDFKGLNVNIAGNPELFGSPHASDAGTLLSSNYSSTGISIGLAMTNAPLEDEIILKIPVIGIPDQPVILNLLVNNKEKQIDLGILTGLSETFQKSIEMYPNPANTILYFKNLPKNVSISIFDLQGRKIIAETIINNQIDISRLDYGIYTILIEDSKNIKIGKLLKQ